MNEPNIDGPSQVNEWATRQLADYDARTPGTLFGEGLVLDVEQGYALQSSVVELRCARGEKIVGYKVGCTSPTIRSQLGIDHCVTGRLFDSERHSSEVELSRRSFANLAIEGELAVELAREPVVADFDGVGIPDCVARLFPVIELHHLVLRGEPPSAGELIANNAINGGFVEGLRVGRDDVCGDVSLTIYSDDKLLEECDGAALIQTIQSSLKWLMETAAERGDRLCAGQIVLTGSIPSLIPISHDCRIRVESPPFGSVDATFNS